MVARARQAKGELLEQVSAELSHPVDELARAATKLAAGDLPPEAAEAVKEMVYAIERIRAVLEHLPKRSGEDPPPSGPAALADSPR